MERVKEWKDGSGDTFAVIYKPESQEISISSMPNNGAERDRVVKVYARNGEDAFGILVRQGASDTNWESKGGLMGWGVKGSVGFGHLEGVDLRCVVFLNKEGDACTVRLISVEDE